MGLLTGPIIETAFGLRKIGSKLVLAVLVTSIILVITGKKIILPESESQTLVNGSLIFGVYINILLIIMFGVRLSLQDGYKQVSQYKKIILERLESIGAVILTWGIIEFSPEIITKGVGLVGLFVFLYLYIFREPIAKEKKSETDNQPREG